MILSNFLFSVNLSPFRAFGILHDGTKTLLSGLGQELKEVYEREKLEKLCKLWRQAVDKRFKTYEPLSWAPPPQQDPAAAA